MLSTVVPPPQTPRHLNMGFTLYHDEEQRTPTLVQVKEIMSTFSTCYCVDLMSPMLILRCRQLPPAPWPLTVAGVPVWLTTDPDHYPLEIGQPAGGIPSVLTMEFRVLETRSENRIVQRQMYGAR